MSTMPPLHTPDLPVGPRLAIDRRMCVAANRWGTRRAVGVFFGIISRLGDGVFWYSLMAVLALIDGRRGLLAATQMAVTGLTALFLYRLLKRWTRRPRPFRACPGVIAHVPPLDEFSFPSGHTLQAVSFTVVALAWYPLLAPLLLTFTTLVGASRVILGLHYPSDVMAATAIGGALGALSLWLLPLRALVG
ncbi:phosphatase PAP2 family protein [Dyella jiangningensis]|uniref:undecaprenyl-diphosphate phosphatase n=1 Tax=Dyella jiangningensis TaxID=1379159 RepID=A0A328P914_9GAMM|nr:phosphatase PAP2 family protein [Dyella jiangningensis]RAO77793.1 phosphatase PAP2 family protein [Dyella jiangningensis]